MNTQLAETNFPGTDETAKAGGIDAPEDIIRTSATDTTQSGLDPECAGAEAEAELGMALQQAGAFADAADAYRRAIRLRPDWADAHAMLAVALQSCGALDSAILSYRQALKLKEDAKIYSNLGVLLLTVGRSDEAIEALRRATIIDPRFPEAHANLGVALRTQGQTEPAIAAFRKAISLKPTYAEAHANLGVCLQLSGKLGDAATSLRVATILKPGYAEAYVHLGNVAYALKRPAEAVEACRAAIDSGTHAAEVYLTMGVALQDLGRNDDAEAAYGRAIDIAPDSADAYSNLGVVLLEQSKLDAAVSAFRKAIALQPSHRHARANLAIALHEQGNDVEAASCFKIAIQNCPDDADIYSNFAMLRIHQGRSDDALALLEKAATLNQDHARTLGDRIDIPLFRIKHDAEQLGFLKRHGLLAPAFESYADFIESLALRRENGHDTASKLTIEGKDVSQVSPSYNRLVHVPQSSHASGPYLNPELDVEKIEREYAESRPEVVCIDEFLSPGALEGIRKFCLEATVWKKEYSNGYLGATLKDGFASPLLLQIAEDLRTKFPNIFQNHLLEQAWAFKYDSTMKGINVHADFARVNVNFWITRGEACLNPDSGGLVIWDKESPRNWSFQKYNGDEAEIRRFLSRSGSKSIRVPYKENRCVVFNSTLFHETDRFEFNDAYEDRRINVTLLYGKGLKMR